MLKATRVLIVDDYFNMLHILRSCLKQLGIIDVREATDGEAAYDLLNLRHFDLVISDWTMEHMTGIELLRAVRQNPDFSDLPFIIVTATNEQNQILEAKEAGVSDYIVKPFSAAVLNRKVKSVLGYGDDHATKGS